MKVNFLILLTFIFCLSSCQSPNQSGNILEHIYSHHPSSLTFQEDVWEIPKLEKFLDDSLNDVTLLVHRDPIVPLVDVTFQGSKGAYALDVPPQFASLSARIIAEGGHGPWGTLPERTPEEVRQWLESRAADLSFRTSPGKWTISFSCLSEDLEQMLLLINALRFSPLKKVDEEFALWKEQFSRHLTNQKTKPADLVNHHFRQLLYGDHVITRYMTRQKLATFTFVDAKKLADRLFAADNMTILVDGYFPESSIPLLRNFLKPWNPRSSERFQYPPLPEARESGIYIQDFKERPDVKMVIGHRGVLRGHPAYRQETLAWLIASQVLGGGFNSRLTQEVRSNRSLTYSIRANPGIDIEYPGLISIAHTGHKTSDTAEILDVITNEIKQLLQDGITEAEFHGAVTAVLSQLRSHYDKPQAYLERYADILDYGFLKEDFYNIENRYKSLTFKEVNDALRKTLKPEDLVVVMVGDRVLMESPQKSASQEDQGNIFHKTLKQVAQENNLPIHELTMPDF